MPCRAFQPGSLHRSATGPPQSRSPHFGHKVGNRPILPSSANEPKIEFSRIRPKLLQHTLHSTPVLPPLARLPGVPPGRERGLSFPNRSGAHFHFSFQRGARAGPLQGGTARTSRSPSPASLPNPRKFVLSRFTGAKQPFGADFSRNFAGVSVTTRGCTSCRPASAALSGAEISRALARGFPACALSSSLAGDRVLSRPALLCRTAGASPPLWKKVRVLRSFLEWKDGNFRASSAFRGHSRALSVRTAESRTARIPPPVSLSS